MMLESHVDTMMLCELLSLRCIRVHQSRRAWHLLQIEGRCLLDFRSIRV